MSSNSKFVYNFCSQRVASQLLRPCSLCTKQGSVFSASSSVTSRAENGSITRAFSQSTQSRHAKPTHRFQGRTDSVQDVRLSKRLRLVKPVTSNAWPYSVNPEKVLVIFLPWLNSKEKHVNKYVQLYLDLGLDILCVDSKPQDFLWPPVSFGVARELSEVLKDCIDYDHYIFHSMSIGSYNLTTFRVLAKDVQEVSELNKKVCGVIYDSIVIGAGRGGALEKSANDTDGEDGSKAIDRFIKGIVGSVKGSNVILPVASLIAKIYFSLTKRHTLDFYERAYDVVRDEPLKVPTLLFASKNDPMCDKDVVKQIVKIWKDEYDVPITLKMWDVSGHAQHLSFHRKEYIDEQRKFLNEIFGKVDKGIASMETHVTSKL